MKHTQTKSTSLQATIQTFGSLTMCLSSAFLFMLAGFELATTMMR